MPDAGLTDGVTEYDAAFHDSYVRQQVVAQVTSSTRPTNVEGRLIAETDTDRIMAGTGSTWSRLVAWSATGRTMAQIARTANQSIPSGTGTYTAISWDTETYDTDAFITATSDTITIPTGLGGVYAVAVTVTWASSPGTDSCISVLVDSTDNRFPIGAAPQMVVSTVSFVYPIAAASTVKVRLSQGSGGNINATAAMFMLRLTA